MYLRVIEGDNLDVLKSMDNESINLIYIDPPFNTGHKQTRTSITVKEDENGTRTGFQGKKYLTSVKSTTGYNDKFDDFIGFLRPRLEEAYQILKNNGSLFFHIDYREVHYCKIMLDEIFGRDSFINEIIWSYDYGARAKNKWSCKHDNILWYAKNPKEYTFNYEASDRIPYMAPALVGDEKAERGKVPTDVWWNTIVSPTGKEKTGYATQKPLNVVKRIVLVHSNEGDTLLDFFCGSGTLGHAALECDRNCILVDKNSEAIDIMRNRFSQFSETATVTFEQWQNSQNQ